MIRNAMAADIPAIVEMSRLFYSTTSYAEWADFNADTVGKLAENLLTNHVMLVADADGTLAGMVGLFVAPHMFNVQVTAAYEVVWWVDPSAQGAGIGKALLAAIEPACTAKGAKAIQMVHLHSSPPQAAAIYERMGFTHTESSYTKRVS